MCLQLERIDGSVEQSGLAVGSYSYICKGGLRVGVAVTPLLIPTCIIAKVIVGLGVNLPTQTHTLMHALSLTHTHSYTCIEQYALKGVS